ncbi:MAG: bifunctional phosphopantothenoylcysteine decarboxylase/phosphopantothenate--cysteine ligase CoaBC [Myxococcales bacterium]|nr:bifunctional phosphopantothenoylcysteine decarboxylase/phosphopantothenate--cysteine ligase CoaBC [Myxococcales bacterium]
MIQGLSGKRIVVGVGGGIAAFKAVEVVRHLQRAQAEVRVVMTPSATRFVGPTTLSGLTGRAAVTDLWDPRYPGEVHVELSAWAQGCIVAPATQNTLARLKIGMADDALLATLACMACPTVLAPAMHERMWNGPANQRNVAQLREDGYTFAGPVTGPLASGHTGMGRMQEPEEIVAILGTLLDDAPSGLHQDLTGRRVLISAGPTQEDLDPVRYITNRSSGRMGFALARAARDRGAEVVVVAGATEVSPPAGVRVVKVRSARDMQAAIDDALDGLDALVMTAAVADYRPAERAEHKLKKQTDEAPITIELVKNPDILAELGRRRATTRPFLVGFAMETRDIVKYARRKLREKRVDLIVANEASVAFGGDDNEATLVTPEGDTTLPRMSKLALAHRIWDHVSSAL